ncbi:MAG TPA: hypothetical protein VIT43_12240 [Candidatus Dormibacteraeota bacterium]
MKNRELGRFWSLRPRLAVTQIEPACAALAVALLFTLLAQPAGPAPAVTQVSAAAAVSRPFVENPLAAAPMVPQACIKRVLALSRKQPQVDLVGTMERDCFGVVTAPAGRLGAAIPTCLQPAGWHGSYGRRLATGCLTN